MAAANSDSALSRTLSAFLKLSADELGVLTVLQSNSRRIERGKELTAEGQTGHKVYILQAGWACSYKIMPDGNRQVITFPIPGDCVGLRSALLRTSDHSFAALTKAEVSIVEGPRMLEVVNEFPRLGAAFL